MKHWLLAIFLCACGGSQSQAQDPVQPPPDPGGSSYDAGPTEQGSPAANTDALSEKECEALLEHVFQLAIASQQESLAEEERPPAADVAKAKAAMRDEMLGRCVGASRVEFHYDCALAATNRAGLQTCVGAK